jgi:hypothetical protein
MDRRSGVRNHLHIKALERASATKGGIAKLAAHLAVPESTLALWMKGKATLPAAMFEKVLDVLLAGDMAALMGSPPTSSPRRPIPRSRGRSRNC